MSCSQIAQASASNGSGRRADAQVRARAHRAADQRVVAEALAERAQVVVDAEREAHPRDRLLEAASRPRRPASQARRSTTRSRAGCAARTTTGRPSTWSRRSSTPPRRRITPSVPGARQAERPARAQPRRASSGAAAQRSRAAVEQVHVDEERARAATRAPPGRCAPAARASRELRCGAARARRCATTTAVAAPATKPVAASAAVRPRRPGALSAARAACRRPLDDDHALDLARRPSSSVVARLARGHTDAGDSATARVAVGALRLPDLAARPGRPGSAPGSKRRSYIR